MPIYYEPTVDYGKVPYFIPVNTVEYIQEFEQQEIDIDLTIEGFLQNDGFIVEGN